MAWDWSSNAPSYTDGLISHGGWEAMVTAHTDIPAEDIPDVYGHLTVHFEEFDEQPPGILRGWTPRDGWPPN